MTRNLFFRKTAKAILLAGIAFAIVLSACAPLKEAGLPIPWQQATPTPTQKPAVKTEEPAIKPEDTQSTPTASKQNQKFVIWYPPEMDPRGDSEAGKLLNEQLTAFAERNDIQFELRPKAPKGSGGLLDSLLAASGAAPASLPDLVILDQEDLALAAEKEVIYPIPMAGFLEQDADWFAAAKTMAKYKTSVYGAPISLDPYVLGLTGVSSVDNKGGWEAIKSGLGKVAFAADDPRGLFVMNMYDADEGKVEDTLGHPQLEIEPLRRTMIYLNQAFKDGHLSSVVSTAQTDTQILDALITGSADIAFIRFSQFMESARTKPGGKTYRLAMPGTSYASGLFFTIAAKDPDRQKMLQSLIMTLTTTDFLSDYCHALGVLPARPSALGTWNEPYIEIPWTLIGEQSEPMPSEAIINRLGPVLRKAVLDVLRTTADPDQITLRALESVQ